MDNNKVLISLLLSLECAHAFSAFMPSVFTIRTFALSGDGDQAAHVADLRAGYIPAVGYALAIGYLASMLLGTYLPLLLTIGTSAAMIGVYEGAMRG
jgi:hypothetical protein